jgi:hypothetical protein
MVLPASVHWYALACFIAVADGMSIRLTLGGLTVVVWVISSQQALMCAEFRDHIYEVVTADAVGFVRYL